nr:M12 family metallopeptidase [Parabacteroides goldsteinii]
MKKINLSLFFLFILVSCNQDTECNNIENLTESKLQSYVEIVKSLNDLSSLKNICETEEDYNLIKEAISITGRFDLQEIAFPSENLKIINFDNTGLLLKSKGDNYVYQGDMILTEDQARLLSNNKFDIPTFEIPEDSVPNFDFVSGDILTDIPDITNTKSIGIVYYQCQYMWPRSSDNKYCVFYVIDPQMTTSTKKMVTDAIAHWEANTNVRFFPRTTASDYIEFFNGDGCWSFVGRKGGKQQLSIDAGWGARGNAIHEIGHAVGFFHEQCKFKRDEHINIHYDNIKSESKSNYQIRDINCIASKGFDFQSIMLYSSKNSDAINSNKPVMTRKDGTEWTAQRNALSEKDIYLLPWMYYYAYIASFG